MAGQVSGLLGLIAFIIYVGGALVLFRYCFMLTPLLDTRAATRRLVLLGVLLPGSYLPPVSGPIYEFYWSGLLLLVTGVLLFLVIMAVVVLVDLPRGRLRPASSCGDSHFDRGCAG